MEYLGQPLIRISEDIYSDYDLEDLENKEVVLEEGNNEKYIMVLRAKPVRVLVEDNKYCIFVGTFDNETSCNIIIDNIDCKSIDMVRHRYKYEMYNNISDIRAFYDNSIIFKIGYQNKKED